MVAIKHIVGLTKFQSKLGQKPRGKSKNTQKQPMKETSS